MTLPRILLIVFTLCSCSAEHSPQTYQLSGTTMGTAYNITIVGENSIEPALITAALEDIENTMSTYRLDSELMQVNAAKVNTWIKISKELYEILHLSEEISLLSDGAFDITAAPLVDLWGFGPNKNNFGSPPLESDIQAAMENVGYQSLVFAEDDTAILKSKIIKLDLSAIAKGYAVDVIAALLETNNISDYLVEIGGEIKSKGTNSQGELWRIAIETPGHSVANRSPFRIIETSGQAVASSGDYRNYFEVNDIYYSHTIDPRSGSPISHALASVTVIAETAALADALATAFIVMGLESAMQIANSNNIPAYFLSKADDVYTEDSTKGFTESYSIAFTPYITETE